VFGFVLAAPFAVIVLWLLGARVVERLRSRVRP
jgi:hypothetical protein